MDGVCLSLDLVGMQSLGPQQWVQQSLTLKWAARCQWRSTQCHTLCIQLGRGCGHCNAGMSQGLQMSLQTQNSQTHLDL